MAIDSIPHSKTCTKCGEMKPLTAFSRDKHKKSGFKSACLACDNATGKKWREKNKDYFVRHRLANPEMYKASGERWRAANPDKVKEIEANRAPRPEYKRRYGKAYYERNKDDLKKRSIERYAENRERNREYAARYKRENPEITQAWIENNRDKLRQYDAKRRSTPKGRIDDGMSSGIRASLAEGKNGRSWESLVGYTLDELMAHLEARFLPGMSWANYGRHGWHIDHVIPKAAFNYESPEHHDFKRAWALSNLQPLWAKDNIVKSAKLSKPFQPSLAF
jgi:hypothetical protein